MSLIRWKNKRNENTGRTTDLSVVRFRNEIDRLFDRFMSDPWPWSGMGQEYFAPLAQWAPSVDIADNDHQINIRAEVPGVDAKDITVTISGNELTIAGEKKETSEEKGEDFWHSERRFGAFKRVIELTDVANPEAITAEYDNGVLSVRVQKLETAKPRTVTVSTGSSTRTPKRVPVGST